LPIHIADYDSDAADQLRADDALVFITEFDLADAGQSLVARYGFPQAVSPADFDPAMLQRGRKG
jgi:hypothetical protein